jgi:restriction system protein
MRPLLQFAADGKEHKFADAVEYLSDYFQLTDKERKELLPSGRYSKFRNRVGWTKTYLLKARLIESPNWGIFIITDRGQRFLNSGVKYIDNDVLCQFPEVFEFSGHKPIEETVINE